MSNCLSKQLCHFTFPPAIYDGSNFFTTVPALLVVVIVTIAILGGVKCYHTVDLLCIFQMANDAAHLFMCVLAICISLEKYLFESFAHFSIELSLLLSCESSLYVLDTRPLSDICYKYFLTFCGFYFDYLDSAL